LLDHQQSPPQQEYNTVDMNATIVPALLAALGYGALEVLVKLGTHGLEAAEVQLIKTIASTMCYLFATLQAPEGNSFKAKGFTTHIMISIVAGICSFGGGLLKTSAMKNGGELGTVSALAATHPAITFDKYSTRTCKRGVKTREPLALVTGS
jgi:uncharacterized membrane protein